MPCFSPFRGWLVMLAVIALARTSSAQPPRIATLEDDPALAHSIGVALASWQAEIVPVQADRPGPDMNEALASAQKIARDANASALLWVAHGTGEAANSCSLWIYDPRTHQITVRALASCPPYDDAASAAVALSVKTVLRDVLASTAAESAKPLPPPPPPEEQKAPALAPAPKHTARVEAFVAGRLPTHADDPVAARFGLEASWFPSWFRGYAGLALAFDAGPSLPITKPGVFSGTFSDVTLDLMVRGRVPIRDWLWIEAGLGPGLHFTSLDGSSPAGDVAGRVNRTDFSLEAMVSVEGAWRWLRVGPVLGGSFLTSYQHYHSGTDVVLDVPVAQAQLGVRIGVELP